MTSDEFNSEYRLLKQIGGKGWRSYTAEHRKSGRAVLVHILDESQVGGVAGLDALLGRLPPREKTRVLDRLTVDRSLVVVTQFLQGFESFESWLRDRTSAPLSPPPMPSDLPPEHRGEFTRLFRSSSEQAPSPSDPATAGPERAPAPAAPEGSKFTDLFKAAAEPSPPRSPPDRATPGPERAPAPAAPEGSKFTDLFRAAAEPSPPRLPPDPATAGPERAPAPAAPEGSKFTDLFRAAAEPSPPQSPPDRATPGPERAPAPAAPEGSKFTDLFRAAAEPSPPLQDPVDRATAPPVRMVGLRMALPPESGSPAPELPRLRPNFGGSPEPTIRPDMPAGLQRPGDVVIRNREPFDEPPPPPSWQGPSEFTRQLGSVLPQAGEFPESAPLEPPKESADQKRSYLPLILVLNLVFILATGVIVYFLLKRC